MKLKYIIIPFFLLSGCATVRDFFGLSPKEEVVQTAPEVVKEPVTKYSDVANYQPSSDRQYKRMTKERLEEESDLQAGAGSLWVMEGQTSYLFAQNKQRRAGDPTFMKMEGNTMKLVQTKVTTIQELLKELAIQKRNAEEKQRKADEEKQRLADIEKEKRSILDSNEADNEKTAQQMAEKRVNERKPASVEPPKPVVEEKEEKIDLKELENIPVKIVERLDGQYKIAGQQIIMIKNKPYKVLTSGLVRFDDFNDQQISSEKLFDTQVDIVHLKKAE